MTNDPLDTLVEKEQAKSVHTLAQLYRKAKEKGLIQPHKQYQ